MRRGKLFFIGLISAIITIISLNITFGRPGYYYDRSHYARHHHCNNHLDDRYRNDSRLHNEPLPKTDSLNNY